MNDLEKYKTEPASLYDKSFFRNYYKSKEWQNIAGNKFAEVLSIKSVVDFGCANGFYISAMKKTGCKVLGYEYCYSSLEPLLTNDNRDIIKYGNVMEPIDCGIFDLVICLEVAEHILPEKSDILLDNITKASNKYIMFSASSSDRSGVGHINIKPKEWWKNEIDCRGFSYSNNYTKTISETISSIPVRNRYKQFMSKSIMMFVKK